MPPSEVPDRMPDELPCAGVEQLEATIRGVCNESTLTRAEVLGVLEAAKLNIFVGWQAEDEGEEEDA